MQHYNTRNPPWIKLHNYLLEDYRFTKLPDHCKLQLLLLWMLFSRVNRPIPNDPKWIKEQLNTTKKLDLDPLVQAGFIEYCSDDSKPLATGKQRADLEERERREENRSRDIPEKMIDEESIIALSAEELSHRLETLHEKWNELAEANHLPKFDGFVEGSATYDDAVQRVCNSRWWENFENGLTEIPKYPYLMGIGGHKDQGSRNKASLPLFVREQTLWKVLGGDYGPKVNDGIYINNENDI